MNDLWIFTLGRGTYITVILTLLYCKVLTSVNGRWGAHVHSLIHFLKTQWPWLIPGNWTESWLPSNIDKWQNKSEDEMEVLLNSFNYYQIVWRTKRIKNLMFPVEGFFVFTFLRKGRVFLFSMTNCLSSWWFLGRGTRNTMDQGLFCLKIKSFVIWLTFF